MTVHFDGPDPYTEQIERHLAFIRKVLESGDLTMLRRRPRTINGRRMRQLLGIKLSTSHLKRRPLRVERHRSHARHVPGKRRVAQYVPV